MTNNILIKLPAVMAKTGKAKSTIYKEITEGSFPRPISTGLRSVAFIESEINDWIQSKISASRPNNLGGQNV